MAKIVTKLNLNKTPQLVEDNSLVFAKNIKLLKDNTIGPDDSIGQISLPSGVTRINGQIVGNNKIYLFCNSNIIVEYDEFTNTSRTINNHKWTYSEGTITGCVTTNNTGETILTICESLDGKSIPIKHINLSHADVADESLYTQNPKIPIVNLNLSTTYTKTIPNGVYQFFVRYKIRENYYTSWYPCSKECFAGTHNETRTIQGKLRYINIHTDSSKSFVFDVNWIQDSVKNYYEGFQIGFILSHDDSVVARSWKEFDFSQTKIYFDYDKSYIEEIDIDDLLKVNYEIFNVKNITYFKNKLYISNYKETEFNTDGSVSISLTESAVKKGSYTFDDSSLISAGDYYSGFGSNSFSTIIQQYDKSKYNSINEITVESSTKITSSEGSVTKFYCAHNENTWPDIYWIYGSDPNDSFFNLFFNPDHSRPTGKAEDDPFAKDPTTNQYYFWKFGVWDRKGTTWLLENKPPINEESWMGFMPWHPFSGRFKWWDSRRDPSEDSERRRLIAEEEKSDHKEDDKKAYIECYTYGQSALNEGLTDTEKDSFLSGFVKGINTFFENNVKYIITSVKVVYGNKEVVIASAGDKNSTSDFSGVAVYDNVNKISDYAKNLVKNIKGVAKSDIFCYYYSDSHYQGPISAIVIEYSKLTFKATGGSDVINIDTVKYNCDKTIMISPNSDYITNDYDHDQHTTLMPFTKYEFYVHFVRSNGIITNGKLCRNGTDSYFIKTSISESDTNFYSIIPSFTLNSAPSDAVAWFMSCCKVGNEVCKCFDYKFTDGRHYVSCIEEDTLLTKLNDNISIYNNSGTKITDNGKYYDSGATEPLTMFGNPGCVSWTGGSALSLGNSTLWIINESSISNNSNKQLIKVTPFIPINTKTYNTGNHMNLPGYMGAVFKLNREIATGIYASGTDIYNKTSSGNNINIEQNTSYISISSSPINYIQSNFNINYLSLTEEINPRIRTIKSDAGNYKNVMLSVNTLVSSDIYEIHSMYRDYTRKYFIPNETNTLTEFNNTIRCSDINTDELYRNIFRFEAKDIYNVPCNKGIIINMFAIANNIYVHTQHSLYKFSGYNTLNSSDGKISTAETDVFNTGISEVFDSENGFGGLIKKSHSLVTFNSYIFYDKAVNTIYAYGGEGQIVSISRSIDKVLNSYGIIDISFVEDYYNDRFFVNLISTTGNICLTYNTASKSFVSIHDLNFKYGFSSRKNSYFVNNSGNKLFNIIKNTTSSIANYSDLRTNSLINYSSYENGESCVDIIYKENYESIKALNYINWICSAITGFNTANFMAEESLVKYAGTKIIIYSDQCETELMTIVDDSGNAKDATTASISDVNSYKYPRFNCGVWSLNYFRDIRNANNLFKYGSAADDKSLIYGKYFVVRLIFKNKNFKLENIHFNTTDYEKTKY